MASSPVAAVEQEAAEKEQEEETEKAPSVPEQIPSPSEEDADIVKQPRPLKRKRSTPPSGPRRATRSMSRTRQFHEPESEPEGPTKPKLKGKERALDVVDEEPGSNAEDNILESPIELTNRDQRASRASSRASSVFLESSSVISQPSPTEDRPKLGGIIRPFFHAVNGFLHHAHGRAAAALTQQQPEAKPKPP